MSKYFALLSEPTKIGLKNYLSKKMFQKPKRNAGESEVSPSNPPHIHTFSSLKYSVSPTTSATTPKDFSSRF
jgi:hypothetical protein